jgi:ABC-type bacteriocin/lantibiotic exporter with double-glycine peptidase domain
MHEYVQKEGCVAPDQSSTKLAVTSLSLRYGPTQTNSIESISFFGHQGEIIGITGPIASGKTTLGKALSGLYPYEGSVLIDGKELRDYTETERSSMISYLGHRAELFTTSIAENISFGDDIDVTKVLHDVCFDKDLTMMSDGIKTIVGNAGVRLSGGQQARIALARALIHKKKIIVLDDPFSAIDMATEETILRNLRQNYQNSLIILISHRLAVFPKLEKIILMQNGKSILSGTHEELIRSSELYASIYRLQNKEGDERHET